MRGLVTLLIEPPSYFKIDRGCLLQNAYLLTFTTIFSCESWHKSSAFGISSLNIVRLKQDLSVVTMYLHTYTCTQSNATPIAGFAFLKNSG
jgi:hypothetical protein